AVHGVCREAARRSAAGRAGLPARGVLLLSAAAERSRSVEACGVDLLANLKIGLHEQTRLQPQIAAAVDAPLTTAADLGARVLHVLLPGSPRWPSSVHRPTAAA